MRSQESRIPLCASLRATALGFVVFGITVSAAQSQEPPAPPTPHKGPVLPGTHVPPKPLPQKPGILLHIDGPLTVEQKKCTAHPFDIKYSLINNTNEPASGTIRAAFNGISLTPAGSAKLSTLAPGKTASGSFSACCPANGAYIAWVEYRNESSAADGKSTQHAYSASDSLKIVCR